jgi:hypothetical protein
MYIALSGYGGVGKDSLADCLIAEHGFKRYAWADTLRLAAEALNPIVGTTIVPDEDRRNGPVTVVIRYKDALETYGYVQAKKQFPEFREVLQKLGTDVGRNLISDNVWVDATLARIGRECGPDDNIVLTDTRFPNEADAIRKMGGYVVRIEREGVGPVNDHPSETSLDDYDFDLIVTNNGPIEDLPGVALGALKFLRNSALGLATS